MLRRDHAQLSSELDTNTMLVNEREKMLRVL